DLSGGRARVGPRVGGRTRCRTRRRGGSSVGRSRRALAARASDGQAGTQSGLRRTAPRGTRTGGPRIRPAPLDPRLPRGRGSLRREAQAGLSGPLVRRLPSSEPESSRLRARNSHSGHTCVRRAPVTSNTRVEGGSPPFLKGGGGPDWFRRAPRRGRL